MEIATERFRGFESHTSILTRALVEWLNTAIVEQNVSEFLYYSNMKLIFGASSLKGTAELEEQRRIRREIEERWNRISSVLLKSDRTEITERVEDLYDSIARND